MTKCFVHHEEDIDIFHDKFYIPTIENCHFIFIVLGLLVQWNLGRLKLIFHDNAPKNNIRLKKDYAEKFIKNIGIEIQSQNWGGNIQLSMEGIAVQYFTNSIDACNNKKRNLIHI